MTRILEQLTPEGGIGVPRESLTSTTRRNLRELEELGDFSFKDVAYKYPIQQSSRYGRRYAGQPHTAYSILISGTGPNGEDVRYVRRETTDPSAGQTLLFVNGKRYFMTKILAQLKA